jgi:AcrR family transcriptional regulator
MSNETLTRERILEAAEEVLRRFGPAKTTVVDVARTLGVSHGSIYRHFPSKTALHDAVTEHWLNEKLVPLAAIAHEDGPASERLRRWLYQMFASKRKYGVDDPELFATYRELAGEARDVAKAHVAHLTEQITHMLLDGVAQGEFATDDPIVCGRAILTATTRFHDPIHVAEWSDPDIDAAFDGVWSLILVGLRPRTTSQ